MPKLKPKPVALMTRAASRYREENLVLLCGFATLELHALNKHVAPTLVQCAWSRNLSRICGGNLEASAALNPNTFKFGW